MSITCTLFVFIFILSCQFVRPYLLPVAPADFIFMPKSSRIAIAGIGTYTIKTSDTNTSINTNKTYTNNGVIGYICDSYLVVTCNSTILSQTSQINLDRQDSLTVPASMFINSDHDSSRNSQFKFGGVSIATQSTIDWPLYAVYVLQTGNESNINTSQVIAYDNQIMLHISNSANNDDYFETSIITLEQSYVWFIKVVVNDAGYPRIMILYSTNQSGKQQGTLLWIFCNDNHCAQLIEDDLNGITLDTHQTNKNQLMDLPVTYNSTTDYMYGIFNNGSGEIRLFNVDIKHYPCSTCIITSKIHIQSSFSNIDITDIDAGYPGMAYNSGMWCTRSLPKYNCTVKY